MFYGAVATALLPFLALAQTPGNATLNSDLSYFKSLGDNFLEILNVYVIPILVTFAIIFFIISLFKYIRGDSEAKKEARGGLLWGVIIIAVIVSVWGLVAVLQNFFGVGNYSTPPSIPLVPRPTNVRY